MLDCSGCWADYGTALAKWDFRVRLDFVGRSRVQRMGCHVVSIALRPVLINLFRPHTFEQRESGVESCPGLADRVRVRETAKSRSAIGHLAHPNRGREFPRHGPPKAAAVLDNLLWPVKPGQPQPDYHAVCPTET